MARTAPVLVESIDAFQKMARAKSGTVAHLYGLAPRYLSLECLKGNVPGAVQKGGVWYVTPAGMESMFNVKKKRRI